MSAILEAPTERLASTPTPPRPRRWTRQEYLRMAACGIIGPEERVELIEGEIVSMSPQNNPHVAAITKISHLCLQRFETGYWVRIQAPLAVREDSQPEPDFAIVAGSPGDYGDRIPDGALLVIEVADSSVDLDRTRKAALYARAGVPEYWIVNLVDEVLEVRRDPVELPSGWEYASITLHRKGEAVAPLAQPDAPVRVTDLLP